MKRLVVFGLALVALTGCGHTKYRSAIKLEVNRIGVGDDSAFDWSMSISQVQAVCDGLEAGLIEGDEGVYYCLGRQKGNPDFITEFTFTFKDGGLDKVSTVTISQQRDGAKYTYQFSRGIKNSQGGSSASNSSISCYDKINWPGTVDSHEQMDELIGRFGKFRQKRAANINAQKEHIRRQQEMIRKQSKLIRQQAENIRRDGQNMQNEMMKMNKDMMRDMQKMNEDMQL